MQFIIIQGDYFYIFFSHYVSELLEARTDHFHGLYYPMYRAQRQCLHVCQKWCPMVLVFQIWQ